MARFSHRRMRIFQESVHLVGDVNQLINEIPSSRWTLADQLFRACVSVALNVAEGLGEYSDREKDRFFRMARRSAAEADAALLLVVHLGYVRLEETFDTQQPRRQPDQPQPEPQPGQQSPVLDAQSGGAA